MKKTISRLTFVILIAFSLSINSIGQANSQHCGNSNKYYIVKNEKPNSNNTALVTSVLASLISVASIFVIWYNVKRQIESVEKNIEKQFKLQEINNIREYIAELIIEISKPDGGKLEEKEYVSEKHKEIEYRLLSFLDESKTVDKKLIDCILKFRHEELTDKYRWINEILMFKNEFVKSKL